MSHEIMKTEDGAFAMADHLYDDEDILNADDIWTTAYDVVEWELMGELYNRFDTSKDATEPVFAKMMRGDRTTPSEVIAACERTDGLQGLARKIRNVAR